MIDINKTDIRSKDYSEAYTLGAGSVTDAESLFRPDSNPYFPSSATYFSYFLGVQDALDEAGKSK